MKAKPAKPPVKKLPNKVKIGYAEYKIEEWNGVEAASMDRYGDYDHRCLLIRIGKGMAPPIRAEVTLHEVLHGISRHFNVPCGQNEEEIVTAMAEGLAQVFLDNEELIDWIQQAIADKTKKKGE